MKIESIIQEYKEDKPNVNQDNDMININEIYASLVFIQNAVQSLRAEVNELSKQLDKFDEAQSVRFDNLDKTIAAVPVQTQRLTSSDAKNLISEVSKMQNMASKICTSLQETMQKQNKMVEKQLEVFKNQESAVNNLWNKINSYENYFLGIPIIYLIIILFITLY